MAGQARGIHNLSGKGRFSGLAWPGKHLNESSRLVQAACKLFYRSTLKVLHRTSLQNAQCTE